MVSEFAVGQGIGNYTLKRIESYRQVQGWYLELEHNKTGARHIHIACPDDNNAFMVTFPTIPQNNTGVAHILEHIVLCGSKKFPVRDPFFSMLPRSLNTFMNAMTSAAWTTYLFSTRNTKDYQNLLEVYLDATFFPNIDELSYKQEAWRFEFENSSDPTTPLEYKGIVFNEMKGAMADPGSRLYQAVGTALFPNITYKNNSGGEPKAIPQLTWQDLKDFHATHYHPSNSYFYTYGNMPLEHTLAIIEKNALSHFDKLNKDWSIPNQTRFTAPVRHEVSYAVAPNEAEGKKAQVVLAWLTAPNFDSYALLCLRILQRVLLANAASPLRKALIESRLGSAMADYSGLNDDPREMVFAVGLKDVDLADEKRIETLILETLHNLVEQGIDERAVDAAIHRFEIESREVSNAGFPFAFRPGFETLGAFLYGGDPLKSLQFDSDLERLQQERRSGRFFEKLIATYLLENPHRATVVLVPDPELNSNEAAEERARLEKIKSALTPEQTEQILQDAARLEAAQNSPHNVDVLPTLELSDVPMRFEDVEHRITQVHAATVGLFPQPTQGLTYIDINFDFSGLENHQKALLPIFAFVLTKIGAGKSNYLELANRVEASTGGVNAAIGFRRAPHDLDTARQSFALSLKTLHRNIDSSFSILLDLFTSPQFDPTHLKNLLSMYKAGLENRVTNAGHVFASRLAEAQISRLGSLRESMEGMTHVRLARELASRDETGLEQLITEFQAIGKALFRAVESRVCVTSEQDQLSGLEERVGALLGALPSQAPQPANELPEIHPLQARARSVATPVAYNVALFKTVPFAHRDAPALMV
ncbi:MAG: insulinase family protein, partial [Deinococcales bacterium]